MGRIKLTLLIAAMLATYNNIWAQADTAIQLTLQKQIPGSFASFYVDALNNIYLINQSNQIKKLDNKFDSVAVFNDVKRYGDIYSLDVSNPLKEVLYYRDFTTIVVLDRFLNPQNIIDLRTYGILQVKAVAASYDNNYWLFDELENKLKKLDDNGNILLESPDFRVLFQEEYNPSNIIDNDGLLYLYDAKNGWLIFDYYGAFKQRVQLKAWKDVQVENKNLLGHDSTYLYTTSPPGINLNQVKTNLSLPSAIEVQKKANKFFVLTKDGLSIYSL